MRQAHELYSLSSEPRFGLSLLERSPEIRHGLAPQSSRPERERADLALARWRVSSWLARFRAGGAARSAFGRGYSRGLRRRLVGRPQPPAKEALLWLRVKRGFNRRE
jgi:hypothetical protein